MSEKSDAALKSVLEAQDVSTLAAVLLELAEDSDAVRKRLACLQVAAKPTKLAAAFRKTLSGWQCSETFRDNKAARPLCQALEAWMTQIERELLVRDPAVALELTGAFIDSDRCFFDRANNSEGEGGRAVAAGCRLWLRAAARCE